MQSSATVLSEVAKLFVCQFHLFFGASTVFPIPHLQSVGAAIGTLVAEFVVTMIKFFLGVKILHSLWFLLKGTYQYVIAAVIMGGCVWGINLLSEISIIFLRQKKESPRGSFKALYRRGRKECCLCRRNSRY